MRGIHREFLREIGGSIMTMFFEYVAMNRETLCFNVLTAITAETLIWAFAAMAVNALGIDTKLFKTIIGKKGV